jgi:transcriptional regulator with XRE-family HTH domain
MSAYVRVCKHAELVARIDEAGTQVDVAAAADLSTQRINQLYTGAHSIIEVRKARRLEETLGVPYGELFTAVDAPLLAPYMRAEPPDSEPGDQPPGDPTDPTAPTDFVSAA